MKRDYRVVVEIRFQLDVAAESEPEACLVAKEIASEVMAESFSRAACVTIYPQYARLIYQEGRK